MILHQVLANVPPNKNILRSNPAESSACQQEDDSPVPNQAAPGTHYKVVGTRMKALMVGRMHGCWSSQPPSHGSAIQHMEETSRLGIRTVWLWYLNIKIFYFPFYHVDERRKDVRKLFNMRKNRVYVIKELASCGENESTNKIYCDLKNILLICLILWNIF